jgi:2,3-bisphosphoglycerate-dependent phosphoglycerate mutase
VTAPSKIVASSCVKRLPASKWTDIAQGCGIEIESISPLGLHLPMLPSMEIILVRHGEPVTAFSETEPVDPELTARGHWQAECLGAWLAHEEIDYIVASSKRRAMETAAPLAGRLGLEPEIISDLVEIDRNAKIYAPPPLVKERFPEYYELMQKGEFEQIGWDSFDVFRARVRGAWKELLDRPRGERVVVACHGGTIGVILSYVLDIQTHTLLDATPFASITRLVVEGGGVKVRSLHEIAHFDGVRERAVGPEGEGFPST